MMILMKMKKNKKEISKMDDKKDKLRILLKRVGRKPRDQGGRNGHRDRDKRRQSVAYGILAERETDAGQAS